MMSIPNLRLSPHTAFTMLLLFVQKRVELTHEEVDTYVDRVVQVLEDVNDTRYLCDELAANNPEE